jgi:GNAT superfamily N-acetyltransferase
MKIVDFDFEPDLLKKFLDFPQLHYASDSNWMPDPAETRLLTPSESRSTIWRNFLALKGDEPCGRVTAMINPRVCDENNHSYGQLGFFECADDLPTARLLIDSAIDWLRAYLPIRGNVLAPMDFDTWHSYRFRTKGFAEPTFFMEPYNPSYYPTLFRELGFIPVSQYNTKTVNNLAPLLDFWESYHRDTRSKGFTVRTFNLSAVTEEMSLIYRLSLDIFCENLFFTQISEAEFRALYAGTARRLDPDLFLFLLDPLGEPVGLCFAIPDHRQPKTANIKTFGVLPHRRNEGIGAGLAYEIYSRFQTKGFARFNHCLMRTGNRADGFDGGLGEVTREYTLYSRSLGS